jgi:hypothetical protein
LINNVRRVANEPHTQFSGITRDLARVVDTDFLLLLQYDSNEFLYQDAYHAPTRQAQEL